MSEGVIALHGGWFGLVDPHYYSSRACHQRVSVDFVTQALMRVLLGFLNVFVEVDSLRIVYSPDSLLSVSGREENRIFAEPSCGDLEVDRIITF